MTHECFEGLVISVLMEIQLGIVKKLCKTTSIY